MSYRDASLKILTQLLIQPFEQCAQRGRGEFSVSKRLFQFDVGEPCLCWLWVHRCGLEIVTRTPSEHLEAGVGDEDGVLPLC